MQKTQFAGLTVLAPDEPVTSDNGAFIGRDRNTIDRFLQIGAKTHRHTGLPGLANPAAGIGASAVSSGGSIAADQTFTLTYTVEDAQGGETLTGPSVGFATQATMDSPSNAPNALAIYEEGGILLTDTYYYAFSFVDDGGGETPVGPSREVQRQPGFKEAKVNLSGMAGPVSSAGAAGWRLYRAVGGGDFGYLSSGTADSFMDDGSVTANCDIPPLEEGTNSTNGESSFQVFLPNVVEGQFINVYLTNSASFVGDALLEQFPLSSAGKSVTYTNVSLLPGQPPDVNTSIGGAHQIDPDTELIDWHWKRPVKEEIDLPSEVEGSEVGDTRLVTDEKAIYFFNEDEEWEVLVFEGAGTGLAVEELLEDEGMGVILFGEDLTKVRPTKFKQYTWIGKSSGVKPTHMAEFDILVDTEPV